jgi:hypothetical protein
VKTKIIFYTIALVKTRLFFTFALVKTQDYFYICFSEDISLFLHIALVKTEVIDLINCFSEDGRFFFFLNDCSSEYII